MGRMYVSSPFDGCNSVTYVIRGGVILRYLCLYVKLLVKVRQYPIHLVHSILRSKREDPVYKVSVY